MPGYADPQYAASLAEFGKPIELRRSGGWVLERQVPKSPYYDAMGCYPLFACPDWAALPADLEEVGSRLVSLCLVTDPFGDYDATFLERCFGDIVLPFKEHFVVDLSHPLNEFVCDHHRRYARRSLQHLAVEECREPSEWADVWVDLYGHLVRRHGIVGLRAFSRESFARQLEVPGAVLLRATRGKETVGMLFWYVQGEVAYYHLGAHSELGYELRSSFGLFWAALEHFAGLGLRWLDLGAGAGLKRDGEDGLTRFKRGWSTGTRTVYFCGRVFDRDRYGEILRAKGCSPNGYFPAYRQGEFI